MGALAECMHARISPSGAMNANALAADFVESALETILHGVAMSLALPAFKLAAVVGDDQFESSRHSFFSARILPRAPSLRWSR